jgi:PKD repeat protein
MNAHRRTLTPLILALALIIINAPPPAAPSAKAQTTDCPGNLVANGNFTAGRVNGAMPSPGAVANWVLAYGSPDVGTAGSPDPGFVSMWGNMSPAAIGEAVRQKLSPPLVNGRTYIISFQARLNPGSPQNYAHFRARISTAPVTSWGTSDTAGRSGAITSNNWQRVSLVWTVPAAGNFEHLAINVENNSTVNHGQQVSSGSIDRVCIREAPPDFPAPANACQGRPVAFSANAPGATSWSWSFGDNNNANATSTQQNPTYTYAAAGTYNVTLCVNGTTNCVTKPVTVNPPPPAPVILGPASTCGGLAATYSVAPTPGATYAWHVSGGTISGAANGPSVGVTWNSAAGGVVGVTVTSAQGCSSSTRIEVKPCDLGLCCDAVKMEAPAPPPVHAGGNVYSFTPTLSTPQNIIRVVADLVSTEQAASPSPSRYSSRRSKGASSAPTR